MSVHRVVTLPFSDHGPSRAAFTEAVGLPGLRQAAVIERAADGTVDVPENQAVGVGAATVGAAATGGLIGLLAGPLGTLTGTTAGALLGDALAARRDQESTAALIVLSADVADGGALLVLDITEDSDGPVDELAARHGTTAHREQAASFTARVRKAWKSAGS
ncbi:histidine kinase [Streptomyces yaizuensis]|uniref:Histidine kinase n=1 Tax=Streptomyces yaizuensis TaxID=2989713 RepID=A0ABQ5NQJ7_9ACTN|nr:histidine kinase [Streptomyces sp. YSPA8]GLF92651.1 histidine kinase [Streptomyces sp. YSPA8]